MQSFRRSRYAETETSLLELDEFIGELEVSFNHLSSDINIIRNSPFKIMYSCRIILPEITFPQFSWKYEEYNMFEIEFNTIITNNEQLSEVHKFHSILLL